MYHLELRQFPHNFCRFNLTERDLREAILNAWARGDWIELGERKWSPHQASLTVLEGPQLPVEQLSMGRGWRNAKRQGKDVTEQLLAAAHIADARIEHEQHAADAGVAGAEAEEAVQLAADSLGLQVLAALDQTPAPVAAAWWMARERYPDHSASDCLKLAELAITSLMKSRLIVLLEGDGTSEPLPHEPEGRSLLRVDAWGNSGDPTTVLMRRA